MAQMSRVQRAVELLQLGARCHRIPERCIVIRGWRMPFCARCFGASIGHVLSIALAIAGYRLPPLISLAFLAVMLLDWGLQYQFGIMSTNTRRLITGILGGFGVNSLLIAAVVACVHVVARS